MQSHNCACLDGDLCHGEGWCQYKLTRVYDPGVLMFCGKDQIIAIQVEREPEFDGTEITIGGA